MPSADVDVDVDVPSVNVNLPPGFPTAVTLNKEPNKKKKQSRRPRPFDGSGSRARSKTVGSASASASAAGTKSSMMSSFRTLTSNIGSSTSMGGMGIGGMGGISSTVTIANLKRERNLLERMLQEREEKISSLQKSIQVQNDHVHKLTSKVEVMERRSKQTVQRFDLKLENAAHEKEMLKTQLKVLYEEMKKMSEDPIHQALRNNNRNSSANSNGSSSTNTASTVHSGRSEEEEILSQIMPAGNPFDENSSSSNISGNSNNNNSTGSNSAHSRNSTVRVETNSDADEKIKLANSAQAILLQSQLYQALTSLKQLRQQTRGMKANYDAVVSSLQHDLVQCMDDKVRSETGLLSQLQSLEHSSRVREEGLREEMKNKDTRIERLMRRIGVLDKIDDDGSLSYMSDDVSVMGGDGDRDGDGNGNGNGKADAEETVDIDCGDTTSAVLDHFTTPAGVGSRSLSSRISDLHSPTSVTANLWKDAELKSPVSFRNQHQDHNPIFKEYSDSFTKRARASATRIMAASASASASAPKNEAAPRLISQNETRNNARAILERSQSRAKMILEKTASTLSSKPIFTPTPTPISVNEVESALAELEAVTEAEVDFGAEESTEGDELGLMLDGEGSESADVELEMESESEFNVSAKDEIRAEGRLRQADAFKGRSGSHDDDGDPDLR